MKTVKDVYDVHKAWIDSEFPIVYSAGFSFTDNEVIDWSQLPYKIICTREQYEQYKAEQENDNMKADWYDYANDLWNGNSLPEINDNVLLNGSKVSVVAHDNNIKDQVCVRHDDGQLSIPKAYWLKPLDHDKHTVKAAPMGWGVKSGIDFEFKDDGEWFVNTLKSSNPDKSSNGTYWKHCRPRMNHPQFMTVAQFDLIPKDVFNLNWVVCDDDVFGKYYIVEFTGLKPNYKFQHEVEW